MSKIKQGIVLSVFILWGFLSGARGAAAATYIIDDDTIPSVPDFLTSDYSNDSLCLQAAIDAAASGDTLIIREGDYWLPTQVTTSKNLNFTGDGTVNVHITLGNGDPGFYFAGTKVIESSFTADAAKDSSVITVANATGVDAGDLVRIYNNVAWSADSSDLMTGETYVAQSVAGNDVTLTTPLLRDYTTANVSKAIFYHPVEINITNLNFYGAGVAADVQGVTLEFCKNSSVKDGYFRGNGAAAMYLRTCYNVEVSGNEIHDSNRVGYGYGVAPVNASSSINIHDNLIRNCRHGITSGNSTMQGINRDIVITGNTIYRDNGISVPIDAHPTTINYTVTGNTIYAGHYDIDGNLLEDDEPAFHDGTFYSEFSNNRVYDGIGVQHRGLKAGGTKIVSDNVITGTNAGIFSQLGGDFQKLDIENNTLETNYGTGFYGVNVAGDMTVRELIISGNTIKNSQNGIYIDLTNNPTATKLEVKNNTVENMLWNGIQVNALGLPVDATFDVSGNTVTGAGRSGIWIELDGGGATSVRSVHDNTISDVGLATGSYGIRLQGTRYVNVYDNIITNDGSGTTNYGIYEENVTVGESTHYSDYNQISYNRILNTLTGTVRVLGANTAAHDNGVITNDSLGAPYAVDSLYALTVNNGTGSGDYAPGTTDIAVTAPEPATGKLFSRWSGYTSCLASSNSRTTTVTMPANDAVLTPVYVWSSSYTFALTLTSGTISGTSSTSGSYKPDEIVTVVADAPAAGKVFDHWTGDAARVSNVNSATTTLTTVEGATSLTAIYRDADSTVYALTVTGGSGTGSYTEGFTVTISADAPATGQVFDRWTGYTSYVGSVTSAITTVTMPPSVVALTATYKTASSDLYSLTVTGGQGTGSYTAGRTVSVVATIPDGQVFDCWTGADGYLSSTIASSATLTMPADSLTVTAVFKSLAAAPTFSIAGGSFTSTQTVTLSSATEGASIRYTTDGTDPDYDSTLYSTPLSISVSTIIRAKAFASGYIDSSISSAAYTINIVTSSGGGGGGGGSTVRTIPVVLVAEIVSVDGNNVVLRFNVRDAKWMIVSDNSKLTGSSWEELAAAKTYAKKDGQTNVYLQFKSSTSGLTSVIELPIAIGSVAVPTAPATGSADASGTAPAATGTLLKIADSFKVYVLIDGKKKWISTPEVFEQLGYEWTSIAVVTNEQLNAYADYEDNLIRTIGDYKVYLVVSGVRRHIPNPEIFLGYGFAWGDVKDVPAETVNKYKEAFLLKESGKDGIYYIIGGVRKLIPTTAIFDSYGDKMEDVQIVSRAELESYALTHLIRLADSDEVWYLEGAVKRRVPSAEVFNKYKFDWARVISVNRTEYDYYATGGVLG